MTHRTLGISLTILAALLASTPHVAHAQANGRTPGVAVRGKRAERISVTFSNTDIRQVLASFAQFSGRSIVPGAGVTGKISAEINNEPWDLALETILRANGMAAHTDPTGIIQVDAIDKLAEWQTKEPLATETYRLSYVPAKEASETLKSLLSERGRIATSVTTNLLVITDTRAALDRVASMIGKLDIETPQVAIDARIVFVNRTKARELGISYDIRDRVGNQISGLAQTRDGEGKTSDETQIRLDEKSVAALVNKIRKTGGQFEGLVTTPLSGTYTLISFIDALQTAELADVQAAPAITTVDNQEAEIWVGEKTPIRVVDVGQGAGSGTGAKATAELVETGIRLRVTPHVTNTGKILMDLHAERSNARSAPGEIGVVFDQQQGKTRMMVSDGQTAVIGGLTVTQTEEVRSGVPFLMDIPLIGRLFRSNHREEQKMDLIILVTPRIVHSEP